MAQIRVSQNRQIPKPHPIRQPLSAEDIDFNFDLLYRVMTSVKGILDDILAVGRGGTGIGSYFRGDLLVATATDTLGVINATTAGYVLRSQGAMVEPAWGKVNVVDPDSHLTGLTSKGDMVVYNGTSYSRLPRGTDGQALVSSASSSMGVEWGSPVISIVDPGADITGFTSKGDLLTYSGSAYVRLPRGADGELLHSSAGVSEGLYWGRVNLLSETTGLTSKGDLLVFNGSTYSRLPAGTDGQFLLSSASAGVGLEWTTVTPGGGPVDTSASQFLVLATNSLLTNERRLVGTANRVTITDGGANNDATLSTPQDLHTGADVQFAGAQLTTATIVTRAAIGTGSLDSSASLHVVGQYYSRLYDDGTCSTTSLPIDWSSGNEHTVIVAANTTVSFSNGVVGGRYVLLLKQDSTGSRTVTWPAAVLWPVALGTPTLSTTGSKTDLFTFLFDGTNYYGNASLTH
jgi:hypothetical protein